MTVIVVTGTGTEVGKTVTTSALAALARSAGRSVAVLKPAQTGVRPGDPGDLDEVVRLAGPVTTAELARFPEPLAPDTAARRAGLPPVDTRDIVRVVHKLAEEHDLVLVEGAGGLLVRLDAAGATLADVAGELAAEVLLVASAGLGTLNTTALTAEALAARGGLLRGVVVGSWPAEPDLASRCNLADLPSVAAAPLLGAVPERAARRDPAGFRAAAHTWLAPSLGGSWDAAAFTARHAPEAYGSVDGR